MASQNRALSNDGIYDVLPEYNGDGDRSGRQDLSRRSAIEGDYDVLRPIANAARNDYDTASNAPPARNDYDLVFSAEADDPEPIYEIVAPAAQSTKCTYAGIEFSIWFSRADLLSVLDKTSNSWEICSCVLLSMLCIFLAFEAATLYSDMEIIFMWAVVASSLFCLLKSVQPDSASPSFQDRSLAFSRAIYFCLFACLAVAFDGAEATPVTIYGVSLFSRDSFATARDVMMYSILAMPAAFAIGLFPRWRTAAHWLFEQIAIHVFGSGGTRSLQSAAYTCLTHLLATGTMFVWASQTFVREDASKNGNHTITIHHSSAAFWFAVMVSIAYIAARMPQKSFSSVPTTERGSYPGDDMPRKDADLRQKRKSWDIFSLLLFTICYQALYHTGMFHKDDEDFSFPLFWGSLSISIGLVCRHILVRMRDRYPWGVFTEPLLKGESGKRAEQAAHLELYLHFAEQYFINPMLLMSLGVNSVEPLVVKFGSWVGGLILTVCSFKVCKVMFADCSLFYLSLALSFFMFGVDYRNYSESYIVDTFVMTVVVHRIEELHLKLSFAFSYNAPWNLKDVMGDKSHMYYYLLNIPHTAMLVAQAAFSVLFSAPLYPFLGSSVFLSSYFRPVRFWERSYTNKFLEKENTAEGVSYQSSTSNNFNSLFYHLLERSLKFELAGMIKRGKWGNVRTGDMYVLTDADNDITALIHVVERGGDFVTFQLRGLEMGGTFCQRRELEALSLENWSSKEGLCCLNVLSEDRWMRVIWPQKLAETLLSFNASMSLRWQTWYRLATSVVLPSYSIARIEADKYFASFESKKILVGNIKKCIIYFAVRHGRLVDWLQKYNENFVDRSYGRGVTSVEMDDDHDKGHTETKMDSFVKTYRPWIDFCVAKRLEAAPTTIEGRLENFVFACCVYVRKSIGKNINGKTEKMRQQFFADFHRLFRGEFSSCGEGDQWILEDHDITRSVLLPALRHALQLVDDYYIEGEDYESDENLYDSLLENVENTVICHESDPMWKAGILSHKPNLMSFRYNIEDSSYNETHFIIKLTATRRSFDLFKINRECVRGFWAGQQQEVVFFRNTNKERGSIQNATTMLRNLANQSCDAPIGYPCFVGSLEESFDRDGFGDEDSTPYETAQYLLGACWNCLSSLGSQSKKDGAVGAGEVDREEDEESDDFESFSVASQISSEYEIDYDYDVPPSLDTVMEIEDAPWLNSVEGECNFVLGQEEDSGDIEI